MGGNPPKAVGPGVTRRTSFRPQAEAEVLEVRNWYEDRRQGLGNEFGTAVGNLVGRVAENPLAFPRVRGEIRRATLHRFPYAIYISLGRRRDHRAGGSWLTASTALAIAFLKPRVSPWIKHAV